jgi:hypothetical protein
MAVALGGELAETENAEADTERDAAAMAEVEMSVMAPAVTPAMPTVRRCRRRADEAQGERGTKHMFHHHAILPFGAKSAAIFVTIAVAR